MGYDLAHDSFQGTNEHHWGTIVNMTGMQGIGSRLASARANKQVSQVKAAAMLEISDKTYKNYELEKREIPLSTAIVFCEAFEVDLEWLVGLQANAGEKSVALVSETIEALFSEAQERKLSLSPNRAAKIGTYIFRNSTQKGTSPQAEAGPIFDMLNDT
ncbi:helix-turn-helix transcriptional regulator [Sandaracinobacter neustonicus]|uniref:Helix-turn-helix transcriptional regulator n=1 Tax=Sandaracinobacter neustonicus TaxID=1715348 RepID=A0A501XE31_9SPHN|nr:helix-turn-helix transcriptional regulator [Sandaracinobacter neustonicus]TPE58544.1 helix-turn-helix transcriptional regulator [Sandaracinobacter neustonicus]